MKSNAIYEQINESTKEIIRQQVEHLEKLSSEADEKSEASYYETMYRGAKTVLSILENDPISKPGTSNWLNQMDREQLQFAIEEAQRILKQKSSLGKVRLYGVFPDNSETKWFYEKEKADQYFMASAAEELKSRHPEVSLERRLVPIEELAEYIGKEAADELLKRDPSPVITE